MVLLCIAGSVATAAAQERPVIGAEQRGIRKEAATLFPAPAARSPLYAPPAAFIAPALRSATRVPVLAAAATPPGIQPAGHYQQHFGFFCKQEWKWEKQTKLPVKLRLGQYEYTQRLEGK